MKKLLLLTVVIFAYLGCNAQQALWGFSQITSPEINADNTVTFRFKAPDAKTVQVTGKRK